MNQSSEKITTNNITSWGVNTKQQPG